MRHVLAVLLLCTSFVVAAQPVSENLWVGVLTYRAGPNGLAMPGTGGEFQPVGALVDGTWRFEREDDPDSGRLRASYGRTPPRWLPVGRALPRNWRAWLTDGRTVTFALRGPLRPTGTFDTARVAVDVKLPAVTSALGETVAGVAISGDVTVLPFVPFSDDVDEDHTDPPPEPIRRAMIDRETRELATALSQRGPSEEIEHVLAELTDGPLRRFQYEHTSTRRVVMPDGTTFTAFEGFRSSSLVSGCPSFHSGGAIVESPGRDPVVLGAWSYLVCNEIAVDHVPLAVITRGGQSCWLLEYQYEDGHRLVLRPPGKVDYLENDSSCDIR